MVNPGKLLKLKGSWDTFVGNHPKFPLFLNAVKRSGIVEGSIIEITVTTPSGEKINSNVKLTQSDLEALRNITDLS